MTPCTMHTDIDAFFASVEQRLNPHLRGRPVIVGSGVIASCSYEARRYGLRAGMPLDQARALCPEAIILEGRQATYRSFANRIFACCRRMSPDIETYLDEAYCDLTGTERLYGSPMRAGEELRRRVRRETGLTVTVGLGTNRMIAKMASGAAKPDGLRQIRPGEEAAFIAGLPIEKLPGVGRATRETLAKLNIETIGDLRQLPRNGLTALFGANGGLLDDRSRGRDTRVVSEKETPKSISRVTTRHRDTASPKTIRGMLYYLIERAARTARDLGIECGRLNLRIRYADFASANRTRTLPEPTSRDKELFETAAEILDRLFTRRVGLRHIGVTLSRFSLQQDHQASLFDAPRDERAPRLYAAMDELRRRFGHAILIAGESVDLMNDLKRDSYGYVLRTPCLTK